MRPTPSAQLAHACAIVATKDAQPVRRALFAALASHSPGLQRVLATWDRVAGTPLATAMVASLAAKCFLEVRFPRDRADLLAVWKYRNEARQFAALQALVPALRIGSVALEPAAILDRTSWQALPAARPRLREAWQLMDHHARAGDFLVAARVASTVGYAVRMTEALGDVDAGAVLVSSDVNPYALGLVVAARTHGRKTCFVTHGHVAQGPPPLDFDLSLLDGAVVREVYERAGPVRGEVVLRGSEGAVRRMQLRLRDGVHTVGVFLSILVDWPAVGRFLARLRAQLQPEHILLRLHPNQAMRDPTWRQHVDLDGVTVSDGDRVLTRDAGDCDLVFAANSSAHLTLLKYGVPTCYEGALDRLDPDYYGFVADGIVAPATDPPDLAAIAAFYEDPGWTERFARFDAGYPDRQEACDEAVSAALRRLVDRA